MGKVGENQVKEFVGMSTGVTIFRDGKHAIGRRWVRMSEASICGAAAFAVFKWAKSNSELFNAVFSTGLLFETVSFRGAGGCVWSPAVARHQGYLIPQTLHSARVTTACMDHEICADMRTSRSEFTNSRVDKVSYCSDYADVRDAGEMKPLEPQEFYYLVRYVSSKTGRALWHLRIGRRFTGITYEGQPIGPTSPASFLELSCNAQGIVGGSEGFSEICDGHKRFAISLAVLGCHISPFLRVRVPDHDILSMRGHLRHADVTNPIITPRRWVFPFCEQARVHVGHPSYLRQVIKHMNEDEKYVNMTPVGKSTDSFETWSTVPEDRRDLRHAVSYDMAVPLSYDRHINDPTYGHLGCRSTGLDVAFRSRKYSGSVCYHHEVLVSLKSMLQSRAISLIRERGFKEEGWDLSDDVECFEYVQHPVNLLKVMTLLGYSVELYSALALSKCVSLGVDLCLSVFWFHRGSVTRRLQLGTATAECIPRPSWRKTHPSITLADIVTRFVVGADVKISPLRDTRSWSNMFSDQEDVLQRLTLVDQCSRPGNTAENGRAVLFVRGQIDSYCLHYRDAPTWFAGDAVKAFSDDPAFSIGCGVELAPHDPRIPLRYTEERLAWLRGSTRSANITVYDEHGDFVSGEEYRQRLPRRFVPSISKAYDRVVDYCPGHHPY